jgi:hypothetical protein
MKKTKIGEIYQTLDYHLFKHLLGNREKNSLHIERLKRSFKEKYLICPIIVNKKHEIIDGQHRFEAAKRLGLPVIFIYGDDGGQDYGLREVQLLNTNTINWKLNDYLEAYADYGYESYIQMKKFMKDFPDFGIGAAERLLRNTTNGTNNDGGSRGKEVRAKTFQEGNFSIPNLSLSYQNARKVLMFKPYYSGYNKSIFVSSMIGIFKNPNYDHTQMIHKLSLIPGELKDCRTVTDYRILLEDIYNYRSRDKISLRY